MEPLNMSLFMLSTIWVGPFWMLMLVEPFSERTETWLKGNLLFLGPLGVWLLATVLNPSGLLDLFTGNPLEFFDTMVSLLGTETGTVLAWAHFVAGDIMATRWMWRKGIENQIGINRIRIIVFFGVMLMPVGLLLHVILNRESTATTE